MLHHISRNKIIGHSHCSDYIGSHSGNAYSDQVECLEDPNIDDPFLMERR